MMFYTYLHTRLDTGEIFYVGKGHSSRAWQKKGRSKWWQSVVNKCGYAVTIAAKWAKEADAFSHEKLLISCLRELGKPLVNICDGGQGSRGFKHTDEHKAKLSLIFKGRKGVIPSPEIREQIRAKLIGKYYGTHRKLSKEEIAIRTASRYKTIPKYEHDGMLLTIAEWAAKLNMHNSSIRYRIQMGKSPAGTKVACEGRV